MISFKQFLQESVVDVPRKHYSEQIFDRNTTDNPKIKNEVASQILSGLNKFSDIAPVKRFFVLGSILTKKYKEDTDIDVNVLFEVPPEKQEEIHEKLKKRSEKVNGELVNGTKHPINYFVIVSEKNFVASATRADGVYDLKNRKFIKKDVEKETLDLTKYKEELELYFKKIDSMRGEFKRSLIDYKEIRDLSEKDIKNYNKLLRRCIKNIEDDINDLIDFYENKLEQRKELFKKNYDELSPKDKEFFDKYQSFNYLPKNVVYKSLEKYKYFEFIDRIKDIVGDENIVLTQKEADKLIEVVNLC
jgi:predicted nucleotidyltransferase